MSGISLYMSGFKRVKHAFSENVGEHGSPMSILTFIGIGNTPSNQNMSILAYVPFPGLCTSKRKNLAKLIFTIPIESRARI